MCRHLEARPACLEEQPGQDTKRALGDSLSDIAEGLELSRKLLLLADGHWKECDHSGRLPLQGILRDCAHKIVTEARQCRLELEASGRVHFGSVVIEESADSDRPDPVAAPQWGGPPFLASPMQDPADRFLSGTSLAVRSRKTEPSPLGAFPRSWAALLARPIP